MLALSRRVWGTSRLRWPRPTPRELSASAAAPLPAVPALLVKQLREQTGAGFVDCQRALQAEGGDLARAVDHLRKKGLAAAAKKSARAAAQGLVAVALAADGASGSLVELNSETDFVARNASFQQLAARLAQSALAQAQARVPASAATASTTADTASQSPEERFAAAAARATALAAAPLPSTAAGAASPTQTAAEGVIELVGKVGENIVLRRVTTLVAPPGGLVCSYVHNAAAGAPSLGSIGVLVVFAPATLPASHASKQAGKCGKGGKGAGAAQAAPPTAAAPAAPVPAPSPSALAAAPLGPAHPAWAPLRELGKRLAMHAAAQRPPFLSPAAVPATALERERAVLLAQALASGKEARHAEAMVKGRLQRFYADQCLLEQPFILAAADAEGGVPSCARLVREASARAGYPIECVAFAVMAVGEGEAAAVAATAAAAAAATPVGVAAAALK